MASWKGIRFIPKRQSDLTSSGTPPQRKITTKEEATISKISERKVTTIRKSPERKVKNPMMHSVPIVSSEVFHQLSNWQHAFIWTDSLEGGFEGRKCSNGGRPLNSQGTVDFNK